MSNLRLRHMTREEVALQNALCTRPEIAFSLGDVPFSLSFDAAVSRAEGLAAAGPALPASSAPAAPASGPAAPAAGVTWKLAVGGAFAWLCLDDAGVFPTLSSLLGGVEFSSLPADVQPLVAEVALEPVLQKAAQVLACGVALAEILPALPIEPHLWKVAFLLRTPDRQTRARLAFADDLRELFGEAIRKASAGRVAAWGALPLVASVEFGRTRLTLAELRSLRRLDILLVEQLYGEAPASVLLNFGASFVVPAQLEGSQVTVTGPPQASTVATAGDAAPLERASPSGSDPRLDAVPLDVVFEHGEVIVPLDQLRTVKAGVSIGLASHADGQRVGLRGGGHQLGFGELVSIGHRVGVRLLDIN